MADELTGLANVGPAVARDLRRAGFPTVGSLAGQDPVAVFTAVCATEGKTMDPCLLDTVMSAVDQADGRPARAWWSYTEERKRMSRTG